jgi:hypothetical protein
MAVLHEHELHYRCAFDIVSATPVEKTWSELLRLVKSWTGGKFRTLQTQLALDDDWFRSGGEWRVPDQPRSVIKTEREIGQGTEGAPQWWAVRIEHTDSQISVRHWRIDIGVTVKDDGQIAFSLTVIHWLIAGFIGQEPPNPVPTAPRLVLDVLNSRLWEVRAGSERLGTSPVLLEDGSASALIKHLQDNGRACPLVLVAKDFSTGEALVDSNRLAKLLVGTAVVWESESSWVDKELERALGRDFSCWNGMVRVYQPRINLNSPMDARKHRFFDKGHIESFGTSKIEELLVSGIVRRSRNTRSSAIDSIEDVRAKQAQIKFAKDLNKAERGSQEWATLWEQENERLLEIVKNKDADIALLQEYGEDADELREEGARLRYELGRANERAQEAESVRSALAVQASIIRSLDHLPSSMLELVNLVAILYPQQLVFTEKAVESAKNSTLKNINVAWKCLRSMATILYDLHFKQAIPFREITRRFRDSTGFEVSIGESETTKKNKKLGAMRKDLYKGVEIDVSPHLKHGNSPGNILRVHYYVHPQDKILVVGHCGDHLDTVRTN